MGQIIKVRCNGPNKDVNEVDLDRALREDLITRDTDFSSASVPERIILRCQICAEGKVILMRAMIESAQR